MKTSLASPFVLFLFTSGFMACAPSAPESLDDALVLVVPASGDVAPTDIGLPPPPVEQLFQVNQFSVGRLHTCAILVDGKLACWGTNYHGVLGIGTTTGARNPKPLRSQAALTDFHLVSAGEDHTCVVRGTNRLVSCWGLNSYGATNPIQPNGSAPSIGCPLNTACSAPSTIPNVSGVRHIAAGWDHTCAWGYGGVDPDGTGSGSPALVCWGRSNTNLLLGAGGGWPVRTYFPGGTALDAGERFTCLHLNNFTDQVTCFGRFPTTPSGWSETDGFKVGENFTDFQGMSVGQSHVCVLTDNFVLCQGESRYGQAGVVNSSFPYLVELENVMGGATAVAAGAKHTCAITNNGGVKCWGANDKGQLGVGETFSLSATPLVAALPSGQVATAIAAGGDTTCVKTASSRLYCWGDNAYGQVGNDSAATVVPAPARVTW